MLLQYNIQCIWILHTLIEATMFSQTCNAGYPQWQAFYQSNKEIRDLNPKLHLALITFLWPSFGQILSNWTPSSCRMWQAHYPDRLAVLPVVPEDASASGIYPCRNGTIFPGSMLMVGLAWAAPSIYLSPPTRPTNDRVQYKQAPN